MSRRIIAALMVSLAWMAAPVGYAADTALPRVVLLANNSGTETTDLLIPYAVLRDADVADVSIAAPEPGPVTLMPGLAILPDTTLAAIAEPPDVAIVPAMHDPTEPALLDLVRRWSASGTLVVSICDGAWVLANAGVLEGRQATSHWYSIEDLREKHPRTEWKQDVRWVRDGNVITSAGVSASEPMARHLVELLAQGGNAEADGPAHDGAQFAVGAADVTTGALNYVLPWRWDVVALELREGLDEFALALSADLLNRTYAVRTVTVGARSPVRGRRGLRVVPEVVGDAAPDADRSVTFAGADDRGDAPRNAGEGAVPSAADFDALLTDIEQRYGARTRSLVALQIEYPPGR